MPDSMDAVLSLLGPNEATQGVPTAAAMCIATEIPDYET